MFLKRHFDLIINTCYEEPTKYKETTPHYLKPSKISWWNKLKAPTDPEKKTPAQHRQALIQNGEPVINMKSCTGFIEFYQNAIALPCPFDIKIKYNKEEDKLDWVPNFSFNGPMEYQGFNEASHVPVVQTHAAEQWGDAFLDMRQIKLSYPWYIEGPKNHKFLLTNNYWQTKKNIQVLNGVLEFYYAHQMHIQFFTEAKSQELSFNYGESPAVLVPLQGKTKYKIHYNYISAIEWNKTLASALYPYGSRVVANKYQKHKKTIDKLTKIK